MRGLAHRPKRRAPVAADALEVLLARSAGSSTSNLRGNAYSTSESGTAQPPVAFQSAADLTLHDLEKKKEEPAVLRCFLNRTNPSDRAGGSTKKLPDPRPTSRRSPARSAAGKARRSPWMTPEASRMQRLCPGTEVESGFSTSNQRSHCSVPCAGRSLDDSSFRAAAPSRKLATSRSAESRTGCI